MTLLSSFKRRPITSLLRHAALTRTTRLSRTRVTVAPRVFPTTGFITIPTSQKLEEENWSWYKPESFYPVRIGEVFHSRYQVLYKLGYGSTSTVWMCRDLEQNTYVCMKSMLQNYPSVVREIKAYECLGKATPVTPLEKKIQHNIRQALDHFQLRHGNLDYHFLVHEPLGVSMNALLEVGVTLPIGAVWAFACDFLHTLDFIHRANIVHADIQPRNILNRIQDETILQELEEDEIANPSPRKITEQSAIFVTKDINFYGSLRRWLGDKSGLVLCDFGEARTGSRHYWQFVQPPSYRAPEVFLHIPWNSGVDIWSFGCMLWHFAGGKQLFPRTRRDENSPSADMAQLATMAALLGRPPRQLLEYAGPDAPSFFNEDGSPKCVVPEQTLESRLASASEGDEDPMTPEEAREFIAFIRRILKWDYLNERPSASDLLMDPWITSPKNLQ